jgi:hypothetical protein
MGHRSREPLYPNKRMKEKDIDLSRGGRVRLKPQIGDSWLQNASVFFNLEWNQGYSESGILDFMVLGAPLP